jgi:hypothetical protein
VAALAQTEPEVWDVPDAGPSGWYEPTPTGSPAPPGPCTIVGVSAGFDPMRTVDAHATWIGTCSSMKLEAAVSGAPTTVASVSSPGPLPHLYGGTDVCELPGGSDLPGTVVNWTATGSEGASGSDTFTLPDLGGSLAAEVASVPEPGHVDPGQRISLRGMAIAMPTSLGVRELTLTVNDEVLERVGNASETTSPEPCDDGRFGAITYTHYDVPQGSPPTIEICARAVGFDGTEAEHCITFFAGEAWDGTVSSIVTTEGGGAGPCGNPIEITGTAHLVVAGDGSVTGTYDVDGCGVSEPHADYTGTVTDAGFLFPDLIVFTNGELIPKVSPTRATATLTNQQGPAVTWVTTWDLTCTSCA